MDALSISADFESGNIEVVEIDGHHAKLRIRNDTGHPSIKQWFYFKATGRQGTVYTYTILNARGASYPLTWPHYRALATIDNGYWDRADTTYDEQTGALTITNQHTARDTWFAFGPPYLAERRKCVIDEARTFANARVWSLGNSEGGAPLDVVTFDGGKDQVWIIARQHAGETFAEYMAEGMLDTLRKADDPLTQAILRKATLHILVCVNPDGAALGNLRCNAKGVDLNRAWHHGDAAPTCPAEIRALKAGMQARGVRYFLDLHADEERPFLWVLHPGAFILDKLPAHVASKQRQFEERLVRLGKPVVSGAPQDVVDSLCDLDVKVAETLAVNHVAREFSCNAWVIEAPFCEPHPSDPQDKDPFLPPKTMRWGRTLLEALENVL